ncbi:MAG: ABC transporter permease [Oscillospiraceae bacterium]|nr:ABC transporter permease [Oscillospiraceae bacterium]
MGSILTQGFILGLIISTIRLSVPLIYASIGETISQRSGLINIGLEGLLVIGAFGAFLGVYFTNNPWIGLLCGALSAVALNMLYAFATITLAGNQIVNGMVLNILALGIANLAYNSIFDVTGNPISVNGFKPIGGEFLKVHPILNAFFGHTVLVYLLIVLVVLSYIFLFHTSLGLKLRAVGENPKAADTLGINPIKIRYLAATIGAAFVGMGGAYLSIAYMDKFLSGMVAGRGFIALAAVIFGKWKPGGVVLACIFFGFADALQLRLQALGSPIPYQFLIALPYILTMVALAGLVGKSIPPASNGTAYIRSK